MYHLLLEEPEVPGLAVPFLHDTLIAADRQRGDKYHSSGSIYIESKHSWQETRTQQAVVSGKEPCSVRKP